MQASFKDILDHLPYTEPFLFVDALEVVSEEGVTGTYQFKEDAFFYKGHFKDFPVTPGVILTECMAQIGVVCLGIFLTDSVATNNAMIALSHHEVMYYKAVAPGETVTVTSKKIYFRFNKLKCKVQMRNVSGALVCEGTISGMLQIRSS
ncbi:hydroxymyristoyl-ACP dehydratase [Altibacter sp.]|uniref:3-hydroxyacyl-ACP dehydratase FabZ family protein n=1 Tax=Altibacter sp. TaxID=2024823 RepID=UPI000C95B04B|nr:hydroxymyristoyl-ACP dehydratase [Altibacter sp.]MAP53823.1 hydroxymyristoyl-ACP dehydratase [Altibacter sp.]